MATDNRNLDQMLQPHFYNLLLFFISVAFLVQFFFHVNSLLTQVIIKQEPGEVSTQQQMVSTVTSQQQPAATAAHQFVAVKGGHMISMSAQKQAGGATGATSSKVSLSCIHPHTLALKHINNLHVNGVLY